MTRRNNGTSRRQKPRALVLAFTCTQSGAPSAKIWVSLTPGNKTDLTNWLLNPVNFLSQQKAGEPTPDRPASKGEETPYTNSRCARGASHRCLHCATHIRRHFCLQSALCIHRSRKLRSDGGRASPATAQTNAEPSGAAAAAISGLFRCPHTAVALSASTKNSNYGNEKEFRTTWPKSSHFTCSSGSSGRGGAAAAAGRCAQCREFLSACAMSSPTPSQVEPRIAKR